VHTSITDIAILDTGLLRTFSGNASSLITLVPGAAFLQYVTVAYEFVVWSKNNTRSGTLASGIEYPNFKPFPNASTLDTPWEVHVAPDAG
jgi:hypothetical protein